MPIVPDTKNWTWVLERECPDCHYDSTSTDFADVPRLTRENVSAWQGVLERTGLDVRPNDSTWSPLEYAAHVRDVFRIMLARLDLMLVLNEPAFANWDQDDTAVEQNYNAQHPATVAAELAVAGTSIADAFTRVRPEELGRRGLRGDGAHFTVESLAKYFIHDPIHHLWDVTHP